MRLQAFCFCLGMFGAMSAAAAADCDEQSNQQELNVCSDQDFEAADRALNDVYAEIVKRLSANADEKTRLVAAQKAWIGFRDAECDFQTAIHAAGSIYPMLVSICLAEMTQKRTGELKVYLSCDEGDTLCPVPAE